LADEMNRPYKRVITNGVFATPAGTPSTDLQVVSAGEGLNITVKAGDGLFGDKWFENPADIIISVPANTNVSPRRDSVIVQVDKRTAGRVGNIVYRTGVPSTSPVPPDMGTIPNVIEYRLANVYVAAGAKYIGNDAIVDLRGSDECPWITSLIKQVDTSTLYTQWQAAYQKYYDETIQRVDDLLIEVGDKLSADLSFKEVNHTVIVQNQTSVVPIGISTYLPATDILDVYVDGKKLIEPDDYTINAENETVTFTKALNAGQKVEFVLLKKTLGGDSESQLDVTHDGNGNVNITWGVKDNG
jgi:hypothetical protein